MTRIAWGLIGCGKHGRRSHILPSKSVEGLELIAVSDSDEAAMNLAEEDYGQQVEKFPSKDIGYVVDGKYYNHGNDIPLLSVVDAVVIASPDASHLPLLAAAINAGKHVLVEKPIIIDRRGYSNLPSILNQAEERGLVISSCHARRYDPPVLWLKKQIPYLSKALGKVIGFEFDFSYSQPEGGWKHSRSLLLDHYGHEIDLIRFVIGDPPFTAQKLYDSYNRYEVVGHREDGISFFFRGTRSLTSSTYREQISIRFEKGSVVFNLKTGTCHLANHEGASYTVSGSVSGGSMTGGILDSYPPQSCYETMFLGVMQNFADAIRGDAPCYLTLNDLYVNNISGIDLTCKGKTSTRF